MDSVAVRQDIALRQWVDGFLKARGVPHPDGRPLYAYRASDDDFAKLLGMLRENPLPAGYGQKTPLTFSMVWFFFAAEWWRRHYNGGGWRWSPLFETIGHEPPPHTQIQRWVSFGRHAWKLTGEIEGGKRYIGEVATQGGIPLRLIATAQGQLSHLLRGVMGQVVTCDLSHDAIRAEVELLSHYLPRTYRQTIIYELLTQLVNVTKSIRQQYLLNTDGDPIDVLAQKYPTWMDQFPIRVDGDSARQLLRGLIKDAFQAESRSRQAPLLMRRYLRFDDSGKATLAAKIDMATVVDPSALGQLLNCDTEAIPPSFQIYLQVEDEHILIAEGTNRNGRVQLMERKYRLPESATRTAVQIRLNRLGETLFRVHLPGSDQLEENAPWIFRDVFESAVLLGVGSVRSSDGSVLLCAASKAMVFSEDGECIDLGGSPDQSRSLYRLNGKHTRYSHQGEVFQIRCGESASQKESFHWQGATLDHASQPTMVYLGVPTLYRLNDDGSGAPVAGGEMYWANGGIAIPIGKVQPVGIGALVWKTAQSSQVRHTAVILPANAKVEYDDEHSDQGGVMWLKNWPAIGVSGVGDGCTVSADRQGTDWRIQVLSGSEVLPSVVDLSVAWPGSQTQRIKLPFPGTGAIFFSADGIRLKQRARIDVSSLIGTRLQLLPGRQRRHWRVLLSLREISGKEIASRIYNYGVSGTIRLFEYITPIKEMLSCSQDLDATVVIEAIEGGSTRATLRVGRYSAVLSIDRSAGTVGFPDTEQLPCAELLEQIEVRTISLTRAGGEPSTLEPLTSQGVMIGQWCFRPEKRRAAPWLIYPGPGCKSSFRPLVWDVPAEDGVMPPPLHGLRAAQAITKNNERMAALSARVAYLIENPGDADWQLLESMIEELGHLPLAGLDIWRAFANNPEAMVMGLLNTPGFHEQVAGRISEELPFEWSLVSPSEWVRSVDRMQRYRRELDGPPGVRALKRELQDMRKVMEVTAPSARLGIDLANHQILEVKSPEAGLLLSSPAMLLSLVSARSLTLHTGRLHTMIRLAGLTARVPTDLEPEIRSFLSRSVVRNMFQGINLPATDYKWLAIGMPVWLGYEIGCGLSRAWLSSPERLHAMRLYREFDSHWFEEGYDLGRIMAFVDHTFEF